jgi:hypothetical protein
LEFFAQRLPACDGGTGVHGASYPVIISRSFLSTRARIRYPGTEPSDSFRLIDFGIWYMKKVYKMTVTFNLQPNEGVTEMMNRIEHEISMFAADIKSRTEPVAAHGIGKIVLEVELDSEAYPFHFFRGKIKSLPNVVHTRFEQHYPNTIVEERLWRILGEEGLGLILYLDPGNASKATIQEVLQAISGVHSEAGGGPLFFEIDGELVQIAENAITDL